MLSNEQGVYLAETVVANNTKFAKGRFRAYENQNGLDKSGHTAQKDSGKRETTAAKKDTGKATKKNAHTDKAKSAKEKARELLLKEEASVRENVKFIQKKLFLLLRAMGEVAIANPIFTHSQLPSLVKYVEPLLSSPIVSNEAFNTMLNFARCLAPPLCNWAAEITAALHVISTENACVVCDHLPPIVEGTTRRSPSSVGIFEKLSQTFFIVCMFLAAGFSQEFESQWERLTGGLGSLNNTHQPDAHAHTDTGYSLDG